MKQAQVSNYLVVAIDTALRDQLQSEGINVYYRDVKVPSIALWPVMKAKVACNLATYKGFHVPRSCDRHKPYVW